jgi:Transposase DDE domain
MMDVVRRTSTPTSGRSDRAMIFPEALPLIKTFLQPVALGRCAQGLLLRCLVAFLMHLGKMSASQAAGAVRSDARHRAQISRFLGRAYWKRTDLLGPLRAALLALEAQQDGLFIFDVDQTFCGSQGRCRENTFSCGNYRQRPRKSHRKQKKTARRSAHGFVMGLLITPSGIRIPFATSFYTKDYCRKTKRDFHTQAELAARLIDQLPVPDGARVIVLGDTAFEAQSIRTACAARKFTWIMPVNPERVLATAKPRPKVTSLAQELHADQMVRLEVHPHRGQYVAYRRIARCRIGPKLKPRTYFVHQESREVHSVGRVRLVFSTTNPPQPGQAVDVQKILMTNDESLSHQDIIEIYQLRWQIELFFKELKSTLGMDRYRFRKFARVETWVQLVLASFLYLEWVRARQLRKRTLTAKQRAWWQAQRTYGLAGAVRQTAERKELDLLADALETPGGRKRLSKLLSRSHPKEYRAAI